MKRFFYGLLFLLLCCATNSVAQIQKVTDTVWVAKMLQSDPIVLQLQDELNYNMSQLKDKPVPAYFMSLRMTDTQTLQLQSIYGTALTSNIQRSCFVAPMVRLGNMQMDNFRYSQNPNIPVSFAPVDPNSPQAMRSAIWDCTQTAYERAVTDYASMQAKSNTKAEMEDKAPCFSAAPVERYYEEPLKPLKIDEAEWEKRLNAATKVFKDCRQLTWANATLQAETGREYIVNSEGTAVVQNRHALRIMLNASIMAPDGMVCPMYKDFFAYSEDELPTEEVLVATAKDMVERLFALRDAPMADPYAGPALLSGGASGVFFHEIFGHRLESHRMKEGGETFKKMVGQSVLPKDFQVYCDPTLSYYNEKALNGYYLYDNEGVKARRVNNVVDGVLTDFLSCRIPIEGFPVSNGHGRGAIDKDPVSRQSNLVIETKKPYSEAELRRMLRDEAKRQGKEYGYYFRTVTSGLTMLKGVNSFTVSPIEVYRVFVDETKPDQLVRGVGLVGTPLAMFSNVAAGGSIPETFTGNCGAESGWVPVTATSPTIFVSMVETQRGDVQKNLPPILPMPAYSSALPPIAEGVDEKDVIFKAMEDEMKRTMDSLTMNDIPLPFFVDYMARMAKQTHIQGSLGAIQRCLEFPAELNGSVNVVLGDSMLNSFMKSSQSQFTLSGTADYDVLRMMLWLRSDAEYKNAVGTYSNKRLRLQQKPLPEEDRSVPEMHLMPPVTYVADYTQPTLPDTDELKRVVREVSAIFCDYPEIFDSKVALQLMAGNQYRLTSEGLRLRVPSLFAQMNIQARVKTQHGDELEDQFLICEKEFKDMPSLSKMKKEVREFARLLVEKAKAPVCKEYYIGPIMLEDEAVNEAILRNVVNPNCIANRNPLTGSGNNYMKLNKRVIDPKLSIVRLHTEKYKGIPMVAWDAVDKDGVTPAERLPLVENGLLRNLLVHRYPALGALQSNGASLWRTINGTNPGVLQVTSTETIAHNKMKEALMQEARKSGNSHAYIIRAPKHGWRYLVRVNAEDGSEEIVRTSASTLPEITSSDFMHVLAVSSEEFVSNKSEFNYRASVITPKSIIVETKEILFDKPQAVEDFAIKRR